ncbi:SRPBCC domain-containing protein [Georgenia alba]|uniref:SRPBCC domain-containing protein n=1 Tax=Georgenia alba TaxID=2233858 RepID=A0ABW2Q6L0_9MICO
MTETAARAATTQVHRIYIDAPAEKVWEALTSAEYAARYGYGGGLDIDPRPGGVYRNLTSDEMKQMGMGDVATSSTIVEIDPPRRLVLDWSAVWHDEPASRLTWEITQGPSGLTRVTLTHELPQSPRTAQDVAGNGNAEDGGGGWPWVLSSLKTVLETGKVMTTAGS